MIDHVAYKQSGRPKQGQQADRHKYKITGQVYCSLTERQARLQEKGMFILATNDFSEKLTMIMTCCLMVYAALKHKIREEFKTQSTYFTDLKYKPTQTPTAR